MIQLWNRLQQKIEETVFPKKSFQTPCDTRIDTGQSAITSLLVCPDGQTIIIGGDNGKINFWRLPGGELQRTYEGRERYITDLAISPNGMMLASASQHGSVMVRLWDVSSDKLLKQFSVAESSLFESWDATANDADGYYYLNTYFLGFGFGLAEQVLTTVVQFQYGPDGWPMPNYGSSALLIKKFGISADGELSTLAESIHDITHRHNSAGDADIAIATDGQVVAFGNISADLVDVATGQVMHSFAANTGHPLLVSQRMAISLHAANELNLWDRQTGVRLNTWSVSSERVRSAAISLDEKLLAVVSEDCTISIYDLPSSSLRRTIYL